MLIILYKLYFVKEDTMKNYIEEKTERIIEQINDITNNSDESKSNIERIIDSIENISK